MVLGSQQLRLRWVAENPGRKVCDITLSQETVLSWDILRAHSAGSPAPWSAPPELCLLSLQLRGVGFRGAPRRPRPWAHTPTLSPPVASALAAEKPSLEITSARLAFLEAWLPDVANLWQIFYFIWPPHLQHTHLYHLLVPWWCLASVLQPTWFFLLKFTSLLNCLNFKKKKVVLIPSPFFVFSLLFYFLLIVFGCFFSLIISFFFFLITLSSDLLLF